MRNINNEKIGNKKKQVKEDEKVIKTDREKGKEMKGHYRYNAMCRKCPVKLQKLGILRLAFLGHFCLCISVQIC
jgi:hypothetical protein